MAYSLYSCYGERLLKSSEWILLSARETQVAAPWDKRTEKLSGDCPMVKQLSCPLAIFQISQDVFYLSTLHSKLPILLNKNPTELSPNVPLNTQFNPILL